MSWFCNSEEAKEHKRTCTKNSWECGKCIWIDESSSAMSKYGTFVDKKSTQQDKQTKATETQHIPTKFDELAKKVVSFDGYEDCDHPLLPEILKVFKK